MPSAETFIYHIQNKIHHAKFMAYMWANSSLFFHSQGKTATKFAALFAIGWRKRVKMTSWTKFSEMNKNAATRRNETKCGPNNGKTIGRLTGNSLDLA